MPTNKAFLDALREEVFKVLKGRLMGDPVCVAFGEFMENMSARLPPEDEANEKRLNDMEQHPEKYTDDGVDPPTKKSIEWARGYLGSCAVKPSRIVSNGEGGVVLEWLLPHVSVSINREADGVVDQIVFVDRKIVSRKRG